MDVRLPDGTVITNVPEGTTKAELLRRLGKMQEQPGIGGSDLLRAGLSGATAGFGDEARGAFTAGLETLGGLAQGQSMMDMVPRAQQVYTDTRDAERQAYDQFAQAHPAASIATEIAGTGVGALASAPAAAAALPAWLGRAATSGPLLGRLGASGAIGGTAGALEGLGRSESLQEAPGDMALYAGMGAAGGGLLNEAVRGGRAAYNAAFNPRVRSARMTARALPDAQEQALRVSGLGEGAVLADTSNSATALLESLYKQPGATRDVAGDMLAGRSAMATERLMATMGEVDYGDLLAATKQFKAQQVAPLYREAYEQQLQMTPELARLWKKPTIQNLWKSKELKQVAQQLADAEDLPFDVSWFDGDPSTRGLDYLVRYMDVAIASAKRGMQTNAVKAGNYGALQTLRKQLSKAMEGAAPKLKKARAAYAGAAQAEDAAEEGLKFLRGSAANIERKLKAMPEGDREFFRMGAREALEDKLQAAGDTHDTAKFFRNEKARRRMKALFATDAEFNKWAKEVQNQTRLQRTYNQVTGGSRTSALEAEREGQQEILGVVLDLIPKGRQGAAVARNIPQWLPGSTAARDMTGEALMSPAPILTDTVRPVRTPGTPIAPWLFGLGTGPFGQQ